MYKYNKVKKILGVSVPLEEGGHFGRTSSNFKGNANMSGRN